MIDDAGRRESEARDAALQAENTRALIEYGTAALDELTRAARALGRAQKVLEALASDEVYDPDVAETQHWRHHLTTGQASLDALVRWADDVLAQR